MTGLLIDVLHMSMAGGYALLAVSAIRLLLRRAPRWLSGLLWLPVWFRFLVPVSFAAPFSLFGLIPLPGGSGAPAMEVIPAGIGMMDPPAVQTGIESINRFLNSYFPAATPAASVNPVQLWLTAAAAIWLAGIAVLLFHNGHAYFRLRARLSDAVLIGPGQYESDRITGPFAFGLLHPRIYIPMGLTADERSYIISHERAHIERLDLIVKPIVLLLVIVHWFNPLAWLAYLLFTRDMEMACDERALRKKDAGWRRGYSRALLAVSLRQPGRPEGNGAPFTGSVVRTRILHILRYKQPKPAVTVAAASLVLLVTVVLVADPARAGQAIQADNKTSPASRYSHFEELAKAQGAYGNDAERTRLLIGMLPWPEGIRPGDVLLTAETGLAGYTAEIALDMNDSAGVMEDGAISASALYPNVALLFHLMEDAGAIRLTLNDRTGLYPGASYSVSFSREEALGWTAEGTDLGSDATEPERLQDLLNRMMSPSASSAPAE